MSRTRSLLTLAAADIVVGAVAGWSSPLVYLAWYVMVVDDDPTLTDDGYGIPIGLGVAALLVVLALYLAVNLPLARRAGLRARWWVPASLVVTVIVGTLVFFFLPWWAA